MKSVKGFKWMTVGYRIQEEYCTGVVELGSNVQKGRYGGMAEVQVEKCGFQKLVGG